MDKKQKSLLIYFETCAVDGGGKFNQERLNNNDREILDKWARDGFLITGRVKSKDIKGHDTNWIVLSNVAWATAHTWRKERAERMGQYGARS